MGAGIMTVAPTWTVEIDAGENNFASGTETVTAQLLDAVMTAGMKSEFQRLADPSECKLIFNDTARYFSPENAAATGAVKGRFLRIRATYNAVTYTVYHGEIWRIKSDEQPYRAVVECRGSLIHAQMRTDITPYPSATADEILTDLLDVGGWREYLDEKFILDEDDHAELDTNAVLGTLQTRSLSTGKTTFTYFGLQYDNPRLVDVFRDIAEAEWGWIYDNPSTGEIVFLDRHSMLVMVTVEHVLSEDNFTALDYKTGEGIINEVYLDLQTNQVLEDTILWTSVAPIRFKRGDNVRVIKFLQGDGRLLGVETDFTAWSFVFKDEPDGGNVILPLYELEPLSTGVRLIVRNDSPTPIYLQIGATISGDAIISETPIRENVVDHRSLSFYGSYPLTLKLPPFADAVSVDYLADFLLYSRAEPVSEVLSVKLQNHTAANLVDQLSLGVADFASISLAQLDHSGNYSVIGYEHHISMGGMILETTVRFIQKYAFWLLDRDGYTELDQTTILGY
jgi:hypothetical protein